MELQRRKSTGARMGYLVLVQHRERTGTIGPAFFRTLFPRLDAELQLVGKPEGSRWQECFRRRFSWAGQHRRVRSELSAAHRWISRSGGWHRVDGLLLPEHA